MDIDHITIFTKIQFTGDSPGQFIQYDNAKDLEATLESIQLAFDYMPEEQQTAFLSLNDGVALQDEVGPIEEILMTFYNYFWPDRTPFEKIEVDLFDVDEETEYGHLEPRAQLDELDIEPIEDGPWDELSEF